MDFRDVDRVLDYRVLIGYTGSLPVSTFSEKVDFSFQSGLHFGENELELSYFIPEEIAQSREISIFIAKSNAEKKGNLHFVNYTLTDPELFQALKSVATESHSIVLDSLMLHRGEYLISLRFNRKDLKIISDLILRFSSDVRGFSVNYLGRNPGMDAIMSDVKGTSELVRFEWETFIEEDSDSSEPFSLLGDEWVSENRFMTKANLVSEVFRTREPLTENRRKGFTTISSDEHLYERTYTPNESLMNTFRGYSYDSRILRFWRTLHFNKGLLRVSFVIPKVQTETMLKVLAKCRRDYPNNEMTLTNIETFI